MTFRPGRRALRRMLVLAAVATAAAPAAALAAYPSPATVRSALATERYYMSYGSAAQPSPAPVRVPLAPALVAEGDPDWAPTIAVALLAGLIGGTFRRSRSCAAVSRPSGTVSTCAMLPPWPLCLPPSTCWRRTPIASDARRATPRRRGG